MAYAESRASWSVQFDNLMWPSGGFRFLASAGFENLVSASLGFAGMSSILPLLALLLAVANAVSGVVMAVRTVITMEPNLTE